MAKRKRHENASVSASSDAACNKRSKTTQDDESRLNSSEVDRSDRKPRIDGTRLQKIDESLLASIPPPPPGSSKGTRKRWRQRQIAKLSRNAAARPSDETITGSASEHSSMPQIGSLEPSISADAPRHPKAISRSLFRKLTRTTLVQRPVKRWLEVTSGSQADIAHRVPKSIDESHIQEVTHTALLPKPNKKWSDVPIPLSTKIGSPSELVATPVPLRSSASDRAAMIAVSFSEDASRKIPFLTSMQEGPPTSSKLSSVVVAAGFSASLDHQRQRVANSRSGAGSIQVKYGNHGPSARSVTSLKASAVPSYCSKNGAQTAFKRFSDFLNHRTGSGSEDDDDESDISSSNEDDDSVNIRLPIASNVHAATQDANLVQKQVTGLQQSTIPTFDETESGEGIDYAESMLPVPESMVAVAKQRSGDDVKLEKSNDSEAADFRSEHGATTDPVEDLRSDPADSLRDREFPVSAAEQAKDNNIASPASISCLPAKYLVAVSADQDGPDCAMKATDIERQPSIGHHPNEPFNVRESGIPAPQSPQDLDDEEVAETSSADSSSRDFDLPLFADSRAAGTSWPANVGLKRSGSFLGPEHGGSLSGSGRSDDQLKSSQDTSESLNFSSRFATSQEIPTEEVDDLEQTIEALSREVFGATRALPDSKQQGSPSRDGDVNVTDLHSGYDLNSLLKAGMTAISPIDIPGIPDPAPLVYICDTPQADSKATLPIREIMQNATTNEQDMDQSDLTSQDRQVSREHSRSSVSDLSWSPPPPSVYASDDADDVIVVASGTSLQAAMLEENEAVRTPATKKRKMTGTTSKHFSPQKAAKKNNTPVATLLDATMEPPTSIASQRRRSPRSPLSPKAILPSADVLSSPSVYLTPEVATTYSRKQSLRKSTTKTSAFFTPADTPTKFIDSADRSPTKSQTPKRRVVAGTSTCLVPPISSERFGLIQEKLWREPFWLIIAVTFLNKTAGRHAAPIFWELKAMYPTPEALAEADQEELFDKIQHLGLGNQRSKRLISIAKTWSGQTPVKGRRHRVLHYPLPGDGKEIKKGDVVEEDSDEVSGALEIGHIPGCGPYAWDSWRIYCRDALRGVADDYNGLGNMDENFEPEWQRVLPLDKELRACLRWMWLREGWIWNHETGKKRRATQDEMDKAKKGEMEIPDKVERKFAVAAAAETSVTPESRHDAQNGEVVDVEDVGDGDAGQEVEAKEEFVTPPPPSSSRRRSTRKTLIVERELDIEVGDDEIVVSPQRKSLRSGKWV